ncbi:uncharacterized protein KGF55_000281 [Candida pseudojiufengensis]|uniref:uncharacterized protein n=1 Tax=Candida pseudojiufengensis TaxID=497109 RepID=UPI0022249982|nr:uncharacterized protein KGF55_000281 [Candida pseudojiufengensis]KAI5966872.1 hypothetical protein KGF55_000281 [Candida pseudojiufengensis]
MKIITEEEKNNHRSYIIKEGCKGLLIGGAISAGIFSFLKYKQPARFATFSPSIKAAIFAMPTIALGAFYADQGSWNYDQMIHQGDYQKLEIKKQELKLQNLTTTDKIITKLNEHKYEIIVGAWGASLYGSWVIINRDKYMTTAQKLVQARVVSQFISIILLLATIGLSIRDAEIKKKQPAEKPHWKRVLEEQGETK